MQKFKNWLCLLMSSSKYFYIFFMLLNTFLSCLIFLINSQDIILSISVVVNLLFSFYLCYRFAPESYYLKLSVVYLLGFSLFIGGRFFANILGIDDPFCFEFGYAYCLSYLEKFNTILLINLSLVSFVYGYLNNKVLKKDNEFLDDINVVNFSKIKFIIIYLLSLLSGFYVIYNTFLNVQKAISSGYLALYESQVEVYSSPVFLMVTLLFNAIVALLFAYKDYFNKIYYYFIMFLFLMNFFMSVLTGARAGFFTALIILIWLYVGKKGLSFIKVSAIPLLLTLAFSVNKIASLSGARVAETGGNFYQKFVEEILYGQGITMMVFSLGSMRNDYPLLAYVKTIIPGSQVIASFFTDIYQYQLSFSQYLMYKLSPGLFYEGYGLGWSLLGDFYAFSFGFIFLFVVYNYFWGKALFFISNKVDKNIFYHGLYFCFLSYMFLINRLSISPLLVLIGFYFLLVLFVKIRWK
ncbi:O-antigen polymerase [Acinetobacter lactucae]|uniref:O-antigen polymerase n=1 Tax=Acinetobacter lactucae TaxID=1785128 RepID=UPI002ADEFB59|nr:O-antigen polymerase [Acinetobacter lactucae]